MTITVLERLPHTHPLDWRDVMGPRMSDEHAGTGKHTLRLGFDLFILLGKDISHLVLYPKPTSPTSAGM